MYCITFKCETHWFALIEESTSSVQGRCSGTVQLSSVQFRHIERSGAGNDRLEQGHLVACDTSRINKWRRPAQLNISE